MVQSAAIVVCLLLLGDTVSDLLGLPVPGSAIGLLALSALLAWRGDRENRFGSLFDFLAPYFPLFFVPAAVGVIANLDDLVRAWLEIAVAIVLGTSAVLVVTGCVAQRLMSNTQFEAQA